MALLFTSHDFYHIHAILGFLCLVSFTYSYSTLTVKPVQWLPHLLLSCSSLIFKNVPAKRIARNPTIIYQEYRLHAIVFTFRSFFIYLAAYEERVMRLIIVLCASLIADIISRQFGDPRQTTVRGDGQARDKRVKILIKLYSSYQILASACHIAGQNSFNGFTTLISIQSSAFLMTLVKKGKIRWYTHAILYSLALVLSVVTMDFGLVKAWVLALCVVARIGAGVNKYLLWIGFALLC